MTPEIDTPPRTIEQLSIEAAAAHDKASHPVVSEPDKGRHRTQEDLWEADLIAAGWKPVTLHPRSAIWRSPDDGLLHGGLGACWSLMKQRKTH
jgi:hypothetical protein